MFARFPGPPLGRALAHGRPRNAVSPSATSAPIPIPGATGAPRAPRRLGSPISFTRAAVDRPGMPATIVRRFMAHRPAPPPPQPRPQQEDTSGAIGEPATHEEHVRRAQEATRNLVLSNVLHWRVGVRPGTPEGGSGVNRDSDEGSDAEGNSSRRGSRGSGKNGSAKRS